MLPHSAKKNRLAGAGRFLFRSLARAGRSRIHPRLERRDELRTRHRHGIATEPRVPSPGDQLVVAVVGKHRLQVLAAGGRIVLDGGAKLRGRHVDEYHLRLRRRQMPVGRAGRHGQAITDGQVFLAVAGVALHRGNAQNCGAALAVHLVRSARVELARRGLGGGAVGAGQGDSTPIRLRFSRLWPERAGEYWMYAEYVKPEDDRQALRQRIFRFQREGARIFAGLYRVPGDPAASVGEWRKDRPFAGVNPPSLEEIAGCRTVWVKQMESLFAAGTEGKRCPGDRPQTIDEHSDFYLASSSIRSWVRGLDASGKQVEGPSGPSEFRKIAAKPR